MLLHLEQKLHCVSLLTFSSPPGSIVLFGRGCVSAGLDDPDRRVACDGAMRVVKVSYHLVVVALGVLLQLELLLSLQETSSEPGILFSVPDFCTHLDKLSYHNDFRDQ